MALKTQVVIIDNFSCTMKTADEEFFAFIFIVIVD